MSKRWALVLGGGTALGVVHEPISARLLATLGMPSVIVGTSIGAVSAAMVGKGWDGLEVLREEWDAVDGARYFQSANFDLWNGLFSLNRLRRRLIACQAGEDLVCPVYVGMVDAGTQQHVLVRLNDLPRADRIDAIIGSCTQPFVHAHAKFQGRYVLDGGVQHVLPPVPAWEQAGLEEWHAVSCSPATADARREQREQLHVAQAWEQGAVAFEMLMTRVVVDDVRRLKQMARTVPGRLYAPQSWAQVGDPFDASPEAVALRRKAAQWMLQHPTKL